MTDQRRAGGPSRSRRSGRRGSTPRRSAGRDAAPKTNKNITPLTPTLEPPDIESFEEFSLAENIQSAIKGMGITKPTPIQALAIEPVLQGKDVIAKAETGTGKTLAFGAPMMSKIDPSRSTVLGLVLSPTRELAEQVHDVLKELGAASGVKTTLIVGGEQMGPQVRALQAGAQVVVGTPGRVLDLLNQRFLQFPWTEFAILDEADKMLEIGFIDDVKKILDACNEYRQTLLFSATFPTPLLELARGYTTDPAEIATASGVSTVDNINQYFLRCGEEDRARELGHLIEDSAEDDVFLVFCERRTDVDQLMRKLERRRFSVKALHGGYDQAARFRVMGAFRTGEVKCLVATDVASRGLDVKHVTHVVNLGVPRDVSDYTHRIGRTGRAGAHGVAVTFVSRRNERDWDNLQHQSGFDLTELKRPRELYSIEQRRLRDAAREETSSTEVEEAPAENPAETPAEAPAEAQERPRRRRGRDGRRGERRPEESSEAPADQERPERDRSEGERPEGDRRRRRGKRSEESSPEARPNRGQEETRETEQDAPRGASGSRDSDDRPRRGRRRRSRDDRSPREERSEDPQPAPGKPERGAGRRPEPEEQAHTKPAPSRPSASDSGFGVGLAEEPKPASEGGEERRPRRRRRGRSDSPKKEAEDRPKREPRGEDRSPRNHPKPEPEPKSAPKGGFGSGI
ncbi:MAG: DEAD/DEAH box helicase [Planctomycetota bacterium]|nr:DEAD/DEAH box helicase [Planctomycetota bacterium]